MVGTRGNSQIANSNHSDGAKAKRPSFEAPARVCVERQL